MKPTIFIGSSTEALNIAEALFSLLERKDVEPTLWTQGVFGLNTSGLESLMEACDYFDYACFVLRKDDMALSRGRPVYITRDNVILELGLFLGSLGRDRVFVIFERGNKPDLPSDLDGINFLDYDPDRARKNASAALTTPCLEIAGRIQKRGRRTQRPDQSALPDKFRVSPLDEDNTRWNNMTNRLEECKKGDTVRFISITGKNFLLPNFQVGEPVMHRPGPRALCRGIKFRGIVLDPDGLEAEFRSQIESPTASRAQRLLIQDAEAVIKLPVFYEESYGLEPAIRRNLRLKYSQVGLSFGLWLFPDIAFVEPFHFGKRRAVQHLCGFAQLAVEKETEEFYLLDTHFEVLWRHGKNVPWCKKRGNN